MRRSVLVGVLAIAVGLTAALLVGADLLGPGGGDAGHAPEGADDAAALAEAEDGGARLRGRDAPTTAGIPDAAEAAGPGDPVGVVEGTRPDGAVVRGRVVRREGGVPVPGVPVRLFDPDVVKAYLRADPAGRHDVLALRTDEAGRFVFRDVLPARGYALRVLPAEAAAVTRGGLDLRGPRTLDLGDLSIGPEAALAGRVVDGEGQPLADVRVAAAWVILNPLRIVLADPDTLPSIEAEARTGEDGTFRLEGLEPGAKTLVVDGGPRGATVVVRAEAPEGATGELGDVALRGTLPLAGTLAWSDGRPIEGARVFAGVLSSSAVATTETDAAGAWRIPALEPGSYVLGTLLPGLPMHLEQGIEAGREDVAITLPAPGVVRGRVRRAGGTPVERFGVVLRSAGEEGEVDFMAQMANRVINQALGPHPVEDERGRFAVEALPGRYQVVVHAEGHPVTASEPVLVTAGEAVDVEIQLAEGTGATGRVVDERGQPVAGARLHVLGAGVEAGGWTSGRLWRWAEGRAGDAVADPEGAFALPPQTPGTYHLVAVDEDHEPALVEGVDLAHGPVEGLQVRMRRAGGLEVEVLDEGGSPAPEAEVVLVYPDGTLLAETTREDGLATLRPLPRGRALLLWYSLPVTPRVRAVGEAEDEAARQAAWEALRPDAQELEIVPDAVLERTLRLPRRTQVRGRATMEGRAQTRGVWIGMPSVGRGHWVAADAEGRFEIALPAGAYAIWAPDAEGSWSASPLEIPEGGGTLDVRVDR